MPQNALNMYRVDQLGSPLGDNQPSGPHRSRHAARHSIDPNLHYGNEGTHENAAPSASSRPTSLQSSYSTNDLPTVKDDGMDHAITPPKTNAALGRVSAAGTPYQAKDSPGRDDTRLLSSQSQQTALKASAAPFGSHLSGAASPPGVTGSGTPAALPTFQAPFYGYGMQPYMGSPVQVPGQFSNYNPAGSYGPYPPYGNYRFAEGPAKGAGSRRTGDGDSAQLSRFANFPLEHYQGELYSLCKDQHGCRYLQRKLEERNAEHVQIIFSEIRVHVVELMTGIFSLLSLWAILLILRTDPFGNYLCQKLLEYSNDDQRTALMNNAAPQLVNIALNQHGTRALQKMIEFISTSEQTQTVVHALKDHVVELVQDLNGNHVVQKCLNRLSAADAQFIYDAVGAHCVVVGTHRHGCCVLQRCIDHASGDQRANLIAQITRNAFSLVQDPFGNYVVQYILDLGESHFTEPLCKAFHGNIPALSKQKFSSNVIEKCLRTAEPEISGQMIDEMLAGNELEKMLRDSFANYVIQTAMDFSDPETHAKIVDAIRPILPSIRQTPHGRRIAGKIMAVESSGRGSAATSGEVTPNEVNSAQLPGPLSSKQFPFPPNPFQPSNVPSQFGGQTYASGAPTNPSTPPSHGFRPTAQQPSGNFGAQNQLYAYF